MNKIFKVIFSKAKGCYVVVSELAKSAGKGTSASHIQRGYTLTLAAAVLSMMMGMAPEGAANSVNLDNGASTYYDAKGNLTIGDAKTVAEGKNQNGENNTTIGTQTDTLRNVEGDTEKKGQPLDDDSNTVLVDGEGKAHDLTKSTEAGGSTAVGYDNHNEGDSSTAIGNHATIRNKPVTYYVDADGNKTASVDNAAWYKDASGNPTKVPQVFRDAGGNTTTTPQYVHTYTEKDPDTKEDVTKTEITSDATKADKDSAGNPVYNYKKEDNKEKLYTVTLYQAASNSIAAGTNVTANGSNAVAVGYGSTADNSAVAIGDTAKAKENAVAIGKGTKASAEGSIALGKDSEANRDGGVAGWDPKTGKASTKTDAAWQSGEGALSIGNGGASRQITNVAAGSEDSDAVNLAQLKNAMTHYYSVKTTAETDGKGNNNYLNDGATGDNALAAGVSAVATGDNATALGYNTSASGSDAAAFGSGSKVINGGVAVGSGATASGGGVAFGSTGVTASSGGLAVGMYGTNASSNSAAFGLNSTTATNSSVAVGTDGTTANTSSFAAGFTSKAGANGSSSYYGHNIAVGSNTAADNGSSAFGINATANYQSLAIGLHGNSSSAYATNQSIAVGNGTNAFNFSTAIGNQAQAGNNGSYAVALGNEASALYDQTTAIGSGAKVISPYGTALGSGTSAAYYATALGNSASANYSYATAIGSSAQATDTYATAVGNGAKANKSGATALGYSASATHDYSTAVGDGAGAHGTSATALGNGAAANSSYDTAIGSGAATGGGDATALGYNAKAQAPNATALGSSVEASFHAVAIGDATASSSYALAAGDGATAQVEGGVALGSGSTAYRESGQAGLDTVSGSLSSSAEPAWKSTDGAISVGKFTRSDDGKTVTVNGTRQIVGVAAGSEDTDAVNVAQLKAALRQTGTGTIHDYSVNSTNTTTDTNYNYDADTGSNALAAGVSAKATGVRSVAVGNGAKAQGVDSIAIGTNAVATGQGAMVIGQYNTAEGQNSMAFGGGYNDANKGNQASSTAAVAFGEGSWAVSEGSVAFGYGTQAGNTIKEKNNGKYTGQNAVAFGNGTKALGGRSLAFGENTTANYNDSVAFGNGATAFSSGATAFGNRSRALSQYSTSFGDNSVAAGSMSFAFGTDTIAGAALDDNGAFELTDGSRMDSYGNKAYTTTDTAGNKVTYSIKGMGITSGGDLHDYVVVTGTKADGTTGTYVQDYQGGIAEVKVNDDGTVTKVKDLYSGKYGGWYQYDENGKLVRNAKEIPVVTASADMKSIPVTLDKATPGSNGYMLKGFKNATAFGYSTEASGDNATAFGNDTKASAAGATAFGYQTLASGENATAFGENSTASGKNSLAGLGGTASNENSIALGKDTKADNADNAVSVAIGQNAEASGAQSLAIGFGNVSETNQSGNTPYTVIATQAAAKGAIAIGINTGAKGEHSIAMGSYTDAAKDSSVAIGFDTHAVEDSSVAIGSGTKAAGRYSVALGLSSIAGTQTNDEKNPLDGGGSVAMGYAASAEASRSIAIGTGATAADSQFTTAVGDSTTAQAEGSVAIGAGSIATRGAGNKESIVSTDINTGKTTITYGDEKKAYLKPDTLSTDKISTWGSTTGAVSVGGQATYKEYDDNGNLVKKTKLLTRQITNVAAGSDDTDAVNVAQLKAAQPTVTSNDHSVTIATSTDLTDYHKNYDLKIATATLSQDKTTGDNPVETGKVTVSNPKISVTENGETKQVDNPNAYVTGNSVADAINNSGFKLTASASEGAVTGNKETLIHPGDTVTIDAGKNISLTQDKGKISIATKDNLNLGSADSKDDKQQDVPGTNGSITVNGKNGSSVAINGQDGSIGLTGPKGTDGTSTSIQMSTIMSDPTLDDDKNTKTTSGEGEQQTTTTQAPRIQYKNGNTTYEVATMDDGLKFAGDDVNTTVAKKLNSTLQIRGDGTYDETTKQSNGNIQTSVEDGTIKVALNDKINLHQDGSLTVGGDKNGDAANGQDPIVIKHFDDKTLDMITGVDKDGKPTTSKEGKAGDYVTGLDNKDWDVSNPTYVSGRAATEDQLKKVSDAVNSAAATAGKHTVVTVNDKDSNNETAAKAGTGAFGDYAGADKGNLLIAAKNDNGQMTYNIKLNDQLAIGQKGEPGVAGKDGKVTVETKGGTTVVIGHDGQDGEDGKDGISVIGKDGQNGVSIIGSNGLEGKDGIDGKISIGTPGKDGQPGKDAVSISGKNGIGHIGLTGQKGEDGKDGVFTDLSTTLGTATLDPAKNEQSKSADKVDADDKSSRIQYQTTVTDKDGKTKTVITHEVATMDDGQKYAGDFGDGASVKLNKTVNVKGNAKKEADLTDGNIGVVSSQSGDNGQLLIKLNKDLNLGDNGSVKMGNTTINNDGMTISKTESGKTTTVTLTDKGLNNGGNKITNVAAGTDGTDAVNVSQLNDVKTLAGQHTTVEAGSKNITVKEGTNSTGGKNYTVDLAKDVAFGDAAKGDKTVAISGTNGTVMAGTGDNKVTVDGSKGQIIAGGDNGVKIGNVEAGDNSLTIYDRDGNATKGTDKAGNYVTNLKNKTWKDDGSYVSGRAATEDQLHQLESNFNTKVNAVEQNHTAVTVNGSVEAPDAGANGTLGNYTDEKKGNLLLAQKKDSTGKITYDLKLNDKVTLGKAGTNGKDGVDGSIGLKGADGQSSIGLNGKDGISVIGADGKNGVSITGSNGLDGKNGIDGKIAIGTPGKDGQPGKDAVSISGKDGVGHIGLTGPKGADGKDGTNIDISTVLGKGTLDRNQNEVKGEDKDGTKDQAARIQYQTTVKEADGTTKTITHEVATMDDGMKYGDDFGNTAKVKLNHQLDIVGDINAGKKDGDKKATKDDLSDGNIGIVATDTVYNDDGTVKGNGKMTVKLAKDLKGLNSIESNSVTTGNTTINNGGLTIKTGDANRTITMQDGNVNMGGNQIHHVAPGQEPDDAVNVSQLNATNYAVNKLDTRVNRVGANAAALAALHPLDFDPDDKWDFSAGYGHYKDANAAAVGAFYRPNEDTMFSVGGSFGGGENMLNAGVSVKLGQGNHVSTSRVAMAKEIKDLKKDVAALKAVVNQQSALIDKLTGVNAGELSGSDDLFPDVPANHWAYEYVTRLKQAGILNGYPDGNFAGDRMMTRYEFAAIVYRAIMAGAAANPSLNKDGTLDRLAREFSSEMKYIRIDTIRKDRNGRPTIQRVRVIKEDEK